MADGYTDPFYVRFTTPAQKNLIIGTSRAAQGLQPTKFEKVLGIKIYNYSFTVLHSPFGKVYFESILKKHNKKTGGIFIVTVDPWSISSWSNNPNDLSNFRENNQSLANTSLVNLNPNFEYLFESFTGNYKDIITPPSKNLFLHKNGWLEVNGISMDSASVKKRILDKIKFYRTKNLPNTKFSKVRLNYLLKTVNYFKKYGKVYLVRLPINSSMMEIENELMPNFNFVIKNVIDQSDGYLDLTIQNDKYLYTDGNHLYKSSGSEVSSLIANWIKEKN